MRHKIVACYSTKSYSSCSEAYVSRTVMSARFHSPSLMIAANASIDYHQELLASLSRINLYNPPVQTCSTGWSFSGFYSGPTSIAYLFYRLSSLKYWLFAALRCRKQCISLADARRTCLTRYEDDNTREQPISIHWYTFLGPVQ
jgi:hypothetical protein